MFSDSVAFSGEKTVELGANPSHKAVFGLGEFSITDCVIFPLFCAIYERENELGLCIILKILLSYMKI